MLLLSMAMFFSAAFDYLMLMLMPPSIIAATPPPFRHASRAALPITSYVTFDVTLRYATVAASRCFADAHSWRQLRHDLPRFRY